mmetsp:Transcript_22606/g.31897  ORF Transcript_22606/g.31897 Transcript_22606/m.31897 type:complete len:115 (-) Transcript_22606:237-581(-)
MCPHCYKKHDEELNNDHFLHCSHSIEYQQKRIKTLFVSLQDIVHTRGAKIIAKLCGEYSRIDTSTYEIRATEEENEFIESQRKLGLSHFVRGRWFGDLTPFLRAYQRQQIEINT